MKKLIIGFLAVVGVLAILAVLVGIGFWMLSVVSKPGVPGTTIVELDLEIPIVEYVPEDPLAKAMLSDATTVRDIVEALETAADDDRVVGLYARIGAGGYGLAITQEIRDAVTAFRESGKPTVAFAETFGEFGPGNSGYYLATAFDEIVLQESGDVGLTGILYESMFLRGAFDKLGIRPQMDQRYEYKNAMNTYTETRYTPYHREAMQVLADSQFGQMVAGIAEARGMDEDRVREIFDRGPYLGAEALQAGLVDRIAYRDQALEALREKTDPDADLLYLTRYLERAGRPHTSGDTIALVYGVGAVLRGRSEYSPLMGDFVMGSDSVASALRAAMEDDDVKAILFRVDSPGGSYVASDTIWRETVRAKEMGKPIIVSMGNVAGSGGYFVAMDADKIVAQPGTITASIGVLGGKMLTEGFWDKLGLSWDEVHTSSNATMFTGTHEYTPQEWARFQAWLDRVYEDFTGKVASGRGMEIEQVLEIAKGRIWTGEAAKELGLVDEVGGFATALRLAREAAGIPEDEEFRLRLFPRPKTAFETFMDKGPDSSEQQVAAAVGRVLLQVRPLARMARALGLTPRQGVLEMPPVESVP